MNDMLLNFDLYDLEADEDCFYKKRINVRYVKN